MAYSIPLEYLNEGKQAEEYLKNKKARKEAEIAKDEKYGRSFDINRDSGSRDSYKVAEKSLEGIRKDPKNKKAVTMEKYRSEYGDVMPNRLTKDEQRMNREIDRMKRADDYAKNMARANSRSRMEVSSDIDFNKDYNAARKHYLKTHKESFSLFENVLFI